MKGSCRDECRKGELTKCKRGSAGSKSAFSSRLSWQRAGLLPSRVLSTSNPDLHDQDTSGIVLASAQVIRIFVNRILDFILEPTMSRSEKV